MTSTAEPGRQLRGQLPGGELSRLDLTPKLRALMASGWSADASQRAASPHASIRQQRRARLAAAFPGETLVIPAGGLSRRNNDVVHRWRSSTEQLWLCGSREPDSVLTIHDGEAVLYQRGPVDPDSDDLFLDPHSQLFDGPRQALSDVEMELGLAVRPLDGISALEGSVGRILPGVDSRIEDLLIHDPEADRELTAWLSEARLVKDPWEVAEMARAVEITRRGFDDVVRSLRDASSACEAWLEGTFARRARAEGYDTGYLPICAAGWHATVLHWTRNDGRIRAGDLVLLDMGAETREHYTADVTRTLPVSGAFSPEQRAVYETVFEAQVAALRECRPGASFQAPYDAAMKVMAAGLEDLGVISDAEAVLDPDDRRHKRWTLHRISHMLGLDVHDCASAREECYRQGVLAPGHVLTIEPGLYFQPNDLLVPEALRGIGVRIEDDVVITADGHRNLSAHIPRRPDDVEEWVREA